MKRFEESDNNAPRGGVMDAERRFAGRVRKALDESANALPQATLVRLALARKAALRAQILPEQRRVPARQLSFAGNQSPRLGFARTGLVFSAIVLVGACLAGLYQVEQDRRIEDLADMDTAVLNDELPISAYADQGFNAFLKQNP
ncbi:MAG: DUF3619 family protein [Burkholderiaceae bacterium]